MNGAQIIIESLIKEHVDTVFGYIGGSVLPIFEALAGRGDLIRHIQPRHEQGGTHAADGYARSTGRVGVVIVTSGPGATNTVTGIATAYMDSVPLVVITGQIPSAKIGTDAFQETDITGITIPITKANFLVRDIKDLALTLKKAFYLARTGRPGPVLVDVPSDIQKQSREFKYPTAISLNSYKPVEQGHPRQIKLAWEMIQQARRPLVVAGGGVICSDAAQSVRCFVDLLRIPLVTTLMGRGVHPTDDDLYLGGIGMHGSLSGNYALRRTDLLIALGTRFSDRSMVEDQNFQRPASIIQVDIDPAEIGKVWPVQVPIVGNVGLVMGKLVQLAQDGAPPKNEAATGGAKAGCDEPHPGRFGSHIPTQPGLSNRWQDWLDELNNFQQDHPPECTQSEMLKPQNVIDLLNRHFQENTIVTADVGQNQMWTAQYYRFRHPRTFISSGGLGTMGYALPAAIGAKLGNPQREVLMVAGDGGFQMNIQELATIRQYGLAIKMVVIDNGVLGMVRQLQEFLCDKHYFGIALDGNPDFAAVARAYGFAAMTVARPEEAEKAVKELAQSRAAMLLHVRIDPAENVLPMVLPGKPWQQTILQL